MENDKIKVLFGLNWCCAMAVDKNGKRCPICRRDLPYRAKGAELRMGDIVLPNSNATLSPYSQSTVVNIKTAIEVEQPTGANTEVVKSIVLFRPYVHTNDFTHSSGVIPYLGFEQYEISAYNEVWVVQESTIIDVRIHETDEGRILRAGGKIARTKDGGLVRVNS